MDNISTDYEDRLERLSRRIAKRLVKEDYRNKRPEFLATMLAWEFLELEREEIE